MSWSTSKRTWRLYSAVKRLLADGGRILVTVPAYRWLWGAHDEFLHHKRRYCAAELRGKNVGRASSTGETLLLQHALCFRSS